MMTKAEINNGHLTRLASHIAHASEMQGRVGRALARLYRMRATATPGSIRLDGINVQIRRKEDQLVETVNRLTRYIEAHRLALALESEETADA